MITSTHSSRAVTVRDDQAGQTGASDLMHATCFQRQPSSCPGAAVRLKSPPLVIKRAAGQGRFTALASTFELDRQGDRIEPGAFARTLTALEKRGGRIPLLWNHDPGEPIGSIEAARETPDGLEVEGVIALATDQGERAYELLKTGALSLSIGFRIARGGSSVEDGVRVIHDIDLAEVSVVSVPANAGAVVHNVKSLYPTPRDLERAARDQLGLSGREAKRLLAGGWTALTREEEPEVHLTPNETATLAALDSLKEIFS